MNKQIEQIRAEIERLKEGTRQLKEMAKELQEQSDRDCNDSEKAAYYYSREADEVLGRVDVINAFIAGAEWGEKNAYKTIMKKADEVRDKRFDTDYEVKFEPAAGFDLGCVNVYREGKLVGQYVEPKEEKKLPEGLDEAAKEYAKQYYVSGGYSPFPNIEITACECAFKAGAEWQKKQMPMPEDTVLFNKGVAEGKRLMMEDAVEAEVTTDNRGNIVVRAGVFNKGFEYGDKVRVIIVKEDEK